MAELTVDHLRHEHQEAREVMAQLEMLLSQLEKDPRWTPERCATFELIRSFVSSPLVLLIRKKNEVLFPALEGLFPLHDGPLALLQKEHQDLLAHFGEVCRAGDSLCRGANEASNLQVFNSAGRKGVDLLHNQIYKEEKILFPMAARFLTAERDADLLARMKALKVE
jgi:hemerythrin-like domain-containing protein